MSIPSLRERKGRSGAARPTSFAGLAKEIDPENEDLIMHRRERLIPLTKSPFHPMDTIKYRELRDQHRQNSHHNPGTPGPMSISGDTASTYAGMLTADEAKDVDKSNDEERGERPPAWLDLFYDLAWAATFSNLTQNNAISGGQESVSYAVFFSMVWWMWVSQVSYDIRFYSNDWFHRCMVFLQLCTFGALAAFTNKFDVTAYVGGDDSDPFQTQLDNLEGVSKSQQDANQAASNRIPELSFLGIAVLIGISRALLCLQYIRVWLYAHDKRDAAVVVKPLAMFISTCLWFGSFAMLYTSGYSSDAAHISKFIMWGVATAVEIAGHAFAPPPSHLMSMGSLTARLATLVTIILGEGLNAITGTLKFAVSSLGFNGRSGGLVFATAVVVYLTFYLYFEGTRPRISKNRRALWICLHLPYMLCVILLMEGLKNLLLYAILYNSYEFVITKFDAKVTIASQAPPLEFLDVLNSTMTPFLAKIGFSWDANWQPVIDGIMQSNSTASTDDQLFIGIYRLLMNITVKVFESFDPDNISPAGRVAVLEYLRNDSLPLTDSATVDGLPNFMNVVAALAQPQVSGARWISALAGGTLVFLAFINVAQSWPKDRYSWGSVLSRFINGCLLLGLLFLNINAGSYRMDESSGDATVWAWLDSYWTLPTLAISLVVQAIIDHVLLLFSVRSADHALERALKRTYQPSELDPLRDAKDHAYDPPMAASHFTTIPGSGNFTTTSPLGQDGNNAASWQPMYNPPTLGYGGTSSPPPQGYMSPHPQHQSSYGFPASQTPFTGSGGSRIPAGGIVTPSR
ncbi:hypothetical protein BDV93DRAFT_527205 [Ceratobasidium sp. AG-I]|nr:hypothetical protein BDV93DRAFT_527205 [Ceratobasidium sp. AG-I]